MWKVKLYAMHEIASFPSNYLRLDILGQCNTSDCNPIFYSFCRLITIVTNTIAHIYAREEQILTIRMIMLKE